MKDKDIILVIDYLIMKCYQNAIDKGFWGDQIEKPNAAEKIALMHSELSEALESLRKPVKSEHCPEFNNVNIELADVLIRVLDFCGYYGIRLGEALIAKMEFNKTRPYKHGKAF